MSEKEQTIFRVNKNADNPFVMMDKRPIENDNLSWKAKGLLSYLLSRPDDWTINMGDLVKRSTDGRAAVESAIDELINAGHIVKVGQTKDKKARFTRNEYHVHEIPLQVFRSGKSVTENHPLSKKESSKKELNNTTTNNGNLFSTYEKNIGIITPMIANKLTDAEKDYPLEWITEAIEIAVVANVRKWNYIRAVLERWRVDGKGIEINVAQAEPEKGGGAYV